MRRIKYWLDHLLRALLAPVLSNAETNYACLKRANDEIYGRISKLEARIDARFNALEAEVPFSSVAGYLSDEALSILMEKTRLAQKRKLYVRKLEEELARVREIIYTLARENEDQKRLGSAKSRRTSSRETAV